MKVWELVILAIALAMDAGAVAICKGLSVKKVRFSQQAIVGLYFGGFQAAMPVIGYFLGKQFEGLIQNIDHWIAFVLLGLIGANMIKEALGESETVDASFGFKTMFPLAVATSIDALAVGVTFAFLKVEIVPAVLLIGFITFIISVIGMKIGNIFGCKYKSRAELVGGVVLIFIGLKILLEHLGILF